jgi:putative protein-disulfide isomerase
MQLNSVKDNVQQDQRQVDQVEITYYTDPLDCWSWAFEPQWRRFLYEFQDFVSYRYVMAGLIPSWKNFNDPNFSVSRPMQMGPVWMEAALASGMPIDDKIWVRNPPPSSFPACIAVKSIELQSKEAGAVYLRRLREAVMLRGENIAEQKILVQIAKDLAISNLFNININRFETDLIGDNGLEAFRKDYLEVQNRNISRFPTLIIRSTHKPAIIITGHRPYAAFIDAIMQVAPAIGPLRKITSTQDYINFFGSITNREIQEIAALVTKGYKTN